MVDLAKVRGKGHNPRDGKQIGGFLDWIRERYFGSIKKNSELCDILTDPVGKIIRNVFRRGPQGSRRRRKPEISGVSGRTCIALWLTRGEGKAMKRPIKNASRDMIRLNPWTLERARSAGRYLRQVLGSLREAYLDHAAAAHRLNKLEHRHGKADTKILLDMDAQKTSLETHHNRIVEAVTEMAAIGAVPGPMHQGIAFLPVVNNKRLAWLIVDLFDDATLAGWRWHGEPESVKHPISEWEALEIPAQTPAQASGKNPGAPGEGKVLPN